MAIGRKRIWLGGTALCFAVLTTALSVASYWYHFEARRLSSSRFLDLDLRHGIIRGGTSPFHSYLPQYFPMGWSGEVSPVSSDWVYQFSYPVSPWEMKNWNSNGNTYIEFAGLASYRNANGKVEIKAVDWPIISSGALFGGVLLLYGLRARRRHRSPHLCPKCNYDRSATPTLSPCPECGTLSRNAPAPTRSDPSSARDRSEPTRRSAYTARSPREPTRSDQSPTRNARASTHNDYS